MNEKGFIKNIIVIIVLLVVVFLSQQPYFGEFGKKLYYQAESQVKTYWNNIYQRVSREVSQKSDIVQQEISKQKNNFAQNIWEKIKNYFGTKFSNITGTEVK